jgi:hypothetical protein
MIGFIGISVASSLNHTQYSAIADLYTFQFTLAHALGFSVSISGLLATDINTETSTSNHYEVFFPLLVQSPWNLGTQPKLSLAASGLVLYSRGRANAENTSHVIAKHCWDVTSLRLRGSVFTELLPRSGLYNPVVPLLVRVLLRKGCFCGSTFLA